MNGDPKASPTSNMVGIEPPYDMALPKITPEIWEVYQDEEFIEDSPRWEWTQAAVDFACEIVRPAVRAEIERLKRGNEILRDELAKIDALHDSVQSERDRLRAALEEIANGGICGSHETHFECPQSEDVCAIARAALSGEPGSAVETSGCAACDRGVLTPHDVEMAAEPIAPGMVDGVRHAMWCACLHTPAGEAMRRPCSCGTLEKTTLHLPGDGTRRAAFNAWWKEMWKDNDPRSSPGFDEQMRTWSLDAWQAGAAHERDRIAAMRSAEKASEKCPHDRPLGTPCPRCDL